MTSPIGHGTAGQREECPRKNAWFGRCDFRPRYDVSNTAPNAAAVEAVLAEVLWSSDQVLAIEALSAGTEKYVCDVCVRCGHVVERPAPPHPSA